MGGKHFYEGPQIEQIQSNSFSSNSWNPDLAFLCGKKHENSRSVDASPHFAILCFKNKPVFFSSAVPCNHF